MIEARSLTKKYGRLTAVDALSFSVEPGVVTGFLGPNGAGKSTTMRMILGLDRPTSGSVTIGGRRYAGLDNPLRTIGALLDARWVHPNRSARNHLGAMAALAELPERRVDEVLDMVGLSAVAGKRAGAFSLGMSQRLGIAGALLGDPDVLMFDEPVNGLDPEGIVWIRTLMQGLARDGRTVLVSSHLLSEMAVTANHLIVIGRGALIADCSTQAFLDQAVTAGVVLRTPDFPLVLPQLRAAGLEVHEDAAETYLITGADISTDQIGYLAAGVGAVIHELSLRRASLEEAFMELTADAVQYSASGVPDSATSDHGFALAAAGK
ncbi:MAG: ATP-binding cassette domain-containing protein [Geodermatophilaceae bacterium]|nr:ATP-binding cassette domain-containing protein [Geodermatophilaceae bacterium]